MIHFEKNDIRFNFRSVAIIRKDDYLLLHKREEDSFWALPGGRVEFLEYSADTVVREIKEELGWESKVIRPVWYIENFFSLYGKTYHETSMYFLVSIIDEIRIIPGAAFNGIEEHINLIFQWVEIANLHHYNVEPRNLISKLKNLPKHLEYISMSDIKA